MGVCVGVSVGAGVDVDVDVGMGVKVGEMDVKVSVGGVLVDVVSGMDGDESGSCPKLQERVARISSVGISRDVFFMSPLYSNPSGFK